ncbi:hypothetical protein [Labilibaculum euxinus]
MENKKKILDKIEFHYEKNPQYRTINADGAYGGVTPTNHINISFYSTRNCIPTSVTHKVNENGSLSEQPIEVNPNSKTGVVREIEFGVYMNRQTAQDLLKFLKTIFETDIK